jgi:hypothetical protein
MQHAYNFAPALTSKRSTAQRIRKTEHAPARSLARTRARTNTHTTRAPHAPTGLIPLCAHVSNRRHLPSQAQRPQPAAHNGLGLVNRPLDARARRGAADGYDSDELEEIEREAEDLISGTSRARAPQRPRGREANATEAPLASLPLPPPPFRSLCPYPSPSPSPLAGSTYTVCVHARAHVRVCA